MRSRDELELIASIADDLAAGIWVATVPDGRFAYANRAFEEIMGVGGLADVAAGQYAEPYGIYDREGALYREDRLPFVRALQTRSSVVVDDIVIHRRDGRRVFVRAQGKPMFDGNGAITHIAIVFFDITREVEAQKARDRAETRLRRVVASAPIVLWTTDRAGVITFCEGLGLKALQRQPEDFIGTSVFDLYPGTPQIAANSRRALEGETVAYLADLGSVLFDTHLAPLRGEAGEIVGSIGVATDVTERRRFESQLAQAERLATVGMLAAGVAHEINNPLAFVIGNLDVLADWIATGDELDRAAMIPMLDDVRVGADRVRDIVRGLKVFSRVTERTIAPIDLRNPLDAAVSMARNEVRHRAQLTLEVESVPKIMGDEGRLGQLFLNLLINAAQGIAEGAAEKNSIKVRVRVEPVGWVRIEISDTGVGIPADVLPRIFDPFFTTKPIGVGTGLGLSICHAIVTDLGGRIEVESQEGRGSTFRVLFPVAPIDAVATQTTAKVAEPTRSNKRGRVLVIDDEPLILKVVSSILAREHDVTSELRAESALERVRGGARFDAIVCDLMMPDMTGIELYEKLREIAPEQAAVMLFVTGGAFTAKAREFLDRAPHPTIEKPFEAEVLSKRVREVVG